jgi:hypothetical protein
MRYRELFKDVRGFDDILKNIKANKLKEIEENILNKLNKLRM